MQNEKALTLIEVLVITAVVALLLAVLMPQLAHVIRNAQRTVCRTNLKGLSTAVSVYGNDYEQAFPLQGGDGRPMWATVTEGWADPDKDWATAKTITVGASLYLLIREADVSPLTFVCPSSGENVYIGDNPKNLDMVQLWDFGEWPRGPGQNGVGCFWPQEKRQLRLPHALRPKRRPRRVRPRRQRPGRIRSHGRQEPMV